MYTASNKFRELEKADSKRVYFKLLWNGSTEINSDHISSIEISEYLADGNDITIGGAYSNACSLVMEKTSGLRLYNSYFEVMAGYDGSEYIPMGRFYVTKVEINLDGMTEITAYDKMAFLETKYTPTVSGLTPQRVVENICSQEGLRVGSYTYPNISISLVENATKRQMLGYIAGLLGKNAVIDRNGILQFKGYTLTGGIYGDADMNGSVNSADVTYINNNLLNTVTDNELASVLGRMVAGKAVLGATEAPENAFLADVNNDGIVNTSDVAEIQAYLSGHPYSGTKVGTLWTPQRLNEDNYVTFTKNAEQSYRIDMLISGTEEAPVTAGNGRAITFTNPYMTQSILNGLYNSWRGFEFFPSEVEWLPMLSYEVGDVVVVEENGTAYAVPITSQTISYDGGLSGHIQTVGLSDDEIKVGTATTVEKEIERNITPQLKQVEEIANTIRKEIGGTVEYLTNPDGSNYGIAIYNADKTKGWVWTYGGLGFFNGQAILPQSVAIDMNGNINANYITTGSLNADLINTGTLKAERVGAGAFNITGGRINILTDISGDSIIRLRWADDEGWSSSTEISDMGISTRSNAGYGSRYVSMDNSTGIDSTLPIKTTSYLSEYGQQISTRYEAKGTCYKYGDSINVGSITSLATYNDAVSYQTNMYVGTTGIFHRTTATSSRKIKHDIKPLENTDLNASKLYDVEVVQFKYNDGILNKKDQRYNQDLCGFIVEQMEEVYPAAVDKNENGEPFQWNQQYIIPPMLKLIQEQHEEIEKLKARVEALEKGV